MKLTPLLIDLVVVGLVFAGGALRRRSPPAGRLAPWIALASSLAAPLVAAAVQAPEWIMAVAVLMMVVGFSGLAAALSARDSTPDGVPPAHESDTTFAGRELQAGPLSDEAWAQFERDFARYVASQARARNAASSRRRRTRHSH